MKRLILILFVLLSAGCYAAPSEGLDLMNDSIAVTAGHAKDPHDELCNLAQSAFTADHDAWQKVRLLVYGVAVDPEVQARTDARAAAHGHDEGDE